MLRQVRWWTNYEREYTTVDCGVSVTRRRAMKDIRELIEDSESTVKIIVLEDGHFVGGFIRTATGRVSQIRKAK